MPLRGGTFRRSISLVCSLKILTKPAPGTSVAVNPCFPSNFKQQDKIDYFNSKVKPLLDQREAAFLTVLQMRSPSEKIKKGAFVHENLIEFFGKQGFTATEVPGAGLVKIFKLQTKEIERRNVPPLSGTLPAETSVSGS